MNRRYGGISATTLSGPPPKPLPPSPILSRSDPLDYFCPSLTRDLETEAGWSEHAVQVPCATENPGRNGTGKALRFGDLNGDDEQDFVVSCENAKGDAVGVFWIENSFDEKNHRSRTYHDISGPEGVKFDRIELLDLDADGGLDVMTCEERDNLGVFWYENPDYLGAERSEVPR